ncbi:MAG: DUF4434 domain-containing protein [Proteiniphilum sp.]|nr:DUF4434 domain-containing protein [Proteiniphilum sp.]
MKRYFLILLFCLIVSLCSLSQVENLRFSGGEFKILQITDTHWVEGESYKSANDSTYNLIHEMIHIEHPNLIVLTGDIVVGIPALPGWEKLSGLFSEEKTPFAVAFGNHDGETDVGKTEILEYLRTNPYNLTYDARKGTLPGVGNCTLPVLSSDGTTEKWILYLFDSHNITDDRSFGYYDWIKHDQIDWYRNSSDYFTTYNKRKLPSLAFFHIPLPEYETARWVCREFGERQEGVCAPGLNTGLFSSFIEKRDVIGVFAGHDHNNDYMIDLDGNIALAYGRKTGYPSAYNETLDRGVRIINLYEDEAGFDTYIRDLNGTYFHYKFEQKNKGSNTPRFNGTFIQEFLVAGWNDERWDQEMAMLNEAGITYLIYAPALLTNEKGRATAYYPSPLVKKNAQKDRIERCLRSAQKYGIKVFIGINFNERWWKTDYDSEWLFNQMEAGNKVADELVALYKEKYNRSMYGWYWVWEVDNLNCMTSECQDALAKALNINLDHLTEITPDMPFMMSPFMNYRVGGNAQEYAGMWENVFAQTRFRIGDIFAPQDCIGAGGLTLDNLREWFSKLKQAVNSKPGLKFWGNVETFDQRFWTSAPIARVQKQLEIVNGYVGNIICFAYSHYNSPFVVNKEYHDLYLQYCKTGELPNVALPEKVINASVSMSPIGIEIKWTPQGFAATDGYNIYKDGILIDKLQVRKGKFQTNFSDKEGSVNNVYEISAYNVMGEESEKTKAELKLKSQ